MIELASKCWADGGEQQRAQTSGPGDIDGTILTFDSRVIGVIVYQHFDTFPRGCLSPCQDLKKSLHAAVKRWIILTYVEDFHGVES